ncbi:Uncharacterized protein PBTT_02447 [Plasmodiophora brassicae]
MSSRDEVHDEDAASFARHKEMFDEIVKKYELHTEEMSGRIADFLTQPRSDGSTSITADGFAAEFDMTPGDAFVFLSWINVGVQYKTKFMSSLPQ